MHRGLGMSKQINEAKEKAAHGVPDFALFLRVIEELESQLSCCKHSLTELNGEFVSLETYNKRIEELESQLSVAVEALEMLKSGEAGTCPTYYSCKQKDDIAKEALTKINQMKEQQ